MDVQSRKYFAETIIQPWTRGLQGVNVLDSRLAEVQSYPLYAIHFPENIYHFLSLFQTGFEERHWSSRKL